MPDARPNLLYRTTHRLFHEDRGEMLSGGVEAGHGFFQTGRDHEQLVVRRKDYIDNAVPSGNSLAAETLLRLSVLVGNDNYRKEATRIIASLKDAAARQPTGFGRLLSAIDTLLDDFVCATW